MATVKVLESQGIVVEVPANQTCCGQPMANTGCTDQAHPLAVAWVRVFRQCEYVVCPSGSCVAMIRHHYHDYVGTNPDFIRLKERTFELCEFLTDVLRIKSWSGSFPYRVGLHQSCHGLRELRMGSCSERREETFSKPGQLLSGLQGINLVSLSRPDECCGFGGTFAVNEESVSCLMGLDRIADHDQAGTQVLTAADMSCLMHLDGLLRRRANPIRVMHIAEILAGHAVPQ